MKYGNYSINENSETSISKILVEIEPKSKVIEFGSASGYILEYLKDIKKCEVHGYEVDENAVSVACEKGVDTTLINLDRVDEKFFQGLDSDIDYIVCADILEHLKYMGYFLELLASYMAGNRKCTLLVSVPNVTYYGVVSDLLHGNFTYRKLGILDNTHLRFCDKFELATIFKDNKLNILSFDSVIVHPEDSEFNVTLDEQLIGILDRYGNKDYLTYQYVVKLQYSNNLNDFVFENDKVISIGISWGQQQAEVIADLKDIVNRKDDQIIELNTLAHSLQASIAERDKQIAERDKQIVKRDKQIVKRDKQIAKRNKKIAGRDKQIAGLFHELDTAVRNFNEIYQSNSWKITAPLRLGGYIVRGDFNKVAIVSKQAKQSITNATKRISKWILDRVAIILKTDTDSSANSLALDAIIEERCRISKEMPSSDPLSASIPTLCPKIDISIVTFNSQKWIKDFINSLVLLNYPKSLLNICFVDNSSKDSTVDVLQKEVAKLVDVGCSVKILRRKNRGYGAGHNVAIKQGSAPFCLITNIDLTFEPDALHHIVSTAVADDNIVASWELRQKPYEHPKFYDPVTGITNWNSHTCVLLRRSTLEKVDYYDETLFMYGEDVELSYRLRRAGVLLRYCPRAVVNHYSYDQVDKVKPLQFSGSTFANLYIRLKYGKLKDIVAIPFLAVQLLSTPEPYVGAQQATIRNLFRLLFIAPKVLFARNNSSDKVFFPFHTWDYEVVREGAFVKQSQLTPDPPLVSIITRTYKGRELYLRQALLSVAHQSYPNIEHIIVEDGGTSLKSPVEQIGQLTNRPATYINIAKLGRSQAGNAGLEHAKGRWCLFLDDDDLLFADHVEQLVSALIEQSEAVASYSLAWEVSTDDSRMLAGKYSEKHYTVPLILRQDYDYNVLKHHNFMAIQSVLFERRLFVERGGFETDLNVLEDWVLWLCYGYGNQFVYVPKVTSMFRTPLAQVVNDNRQKILDSGYEIACERVRSKIAGLGLDNV